jgi:hypothetical protein
VAVAVAVVLTVELLLLEVLEVVALVLLQVQPQLLEVLTQVAAVAVAAVMVSEHFQHSLVGQVS